jgi:hypothetical protein
MNNAVTAYIIARLKEPSTWRGIILAVVGAVGWKLSAGQVEAMTTAGLAVVGLIATFFPDKVGQ